MERKNAPRRRIIDDVVRDMRHRGLNRLVDDHVDTLRGGGCTMTTIMCRGRRRSANAYSVKVNSNDMNRRADRGTCEMHRSH